MTILYEDRHLIVCVKPAGILAQDDADGGDSLPQRLRHYRLEHGEEPYIGVVHRIDRQVGGVMLYAKTKDCAGKLSAMMSDPAHGPEKTYLAVCGGHPEVPDGRFTDLLYTDKILGKTYVVDRVRKGVKEAALDYRVLAQDADASLCEISLHTGRTHQIRVQFSSRHFPLLGDKKYGDRSACRALGLFSHGLAFTHPITGEALAFTSWPPSGEEPWSRFSFIMEMQADTGKSKMC